MKTCFICAMQRLFEFKILPSVRLFIKSERWLVVGFYPHATSVGVFGINLSTLVPIFGSFEGGAQHNEQGNRTIMCYHSHLAIEFYNFKFQRSPQYSEGRIQGAIDTLSRTGPTPRSKRHKSLRTRKPLEQRPVSRLIMTVSFSFLY